jgi:hypothetical protein
MIRGVMLSRLLRQVLERVDAAEPHIERAVSELVDRLT